MVLNVVGLSPSLLGVDTPHLTRFAQQGSLRPIQGVLPAVTCSVQSTYLTGLWPNQHGIVGNGWYNRELAEIMFWKQANQLVAGEKVWETAKRREPGFTCAKLFFWYNMYSSADISITPRPIYLADGLKLPDFYTHPKTLHVELEQRFGAFPLFDFWGPNAGLKSSRWIADAALYVQETKRPSLSLIYLPHLDYDLQRFGPGHARSRKAVREIDALCGELIEAFERDGSRVVVLSEYGFSEVRAAIPINRALREAGLIEVREEVGLEKLDPGASAAFAVADHQVAHVYVKDPARVAEVQALLARLDGVETVLDRAGQREQHLEHARSGELVAISQKDRWFSYYYWLDDARAPEYARAVDIHRKPGYDPVELFVDPNLLAPKLKVGWTLLKKALGFRYMMDVIGLDTSLVRGSHGRTTNGSEQGPVLLTRPELPPGTIPATAVRDVILADAYTPLPS